MKKAPYCRINTTTIGGINMSGKKGMRDYPYSIRNEVAEKQKAGQSVSSLSIEYGISRYAIQTWCGLIKGKETTLLRPKGRPRKKPIPTIREMELEIKRLKREVDLYRSFLQVVGRR
jgi:transposase